MSHVHSEWICSKIFSGVCPTESYNVCAKWQTSTGDSTKLEIFTSCLTEQFFFFFFPHRIFLRYNVCHHRDSLTRLLLPAGGVLNSLWDSIGRRPFARGEFPVRNHSRDGLWFFRYALQYPILFFYSFIAYVTARYSNKNSLKKTWCRKQHKWVLVVKMIWNCEKLLLSNFFHFSIKGSFRETILHFLSFATYFINYFILIFRKVFY